MKKRIIYLVAMVLLLVSCGPTESYLYLILDITDNVKAVIRIDTSDDRRCWSGNEEITILSTSAENCSATMSDIDEDMQYALYPADMEATVVDDRVVTTLTQCREYSNIAEPLMVARWENGDVLFEEASAMLCLNLSCAGVENRLLKSITLSSESQAIAGRVEIDCNELSMHFVDNLQSAISVQGVDTMLAAESKPFYIAMPPLDFEDGELCVTYEFEDGVQSIMLPAIKLLRGETCSLNHSL